MRRRWNISLWAGFLLVLAALVTYGTFFVWIPATRDVPWPTFSILGAGLLLTGLGLRRAFREPEIYRGRITGSVLLILGLGLAGLFGLGFYYFARQLPAAAGAPRLGQKAPEFTLPDTDGRLVSLTEILHAGAPGDAGAERSGGTNGVLLIFYRGYW